METNNEESLTKLHETKAKLTKHIDTYAPVVHYEDMDATRFERYIRLLQEIKNRRSELEKRIAELEQQGTTNGLPE